MAIPPTLITIVTCIVDHSIQVHHIQNFLRMDIATFDELFDLVTPHITYTDTNMRFAIPPGERLAVTLHFLATGK